MSKMVLGCFFANLIIIFFFYFKPNISNILSFCFSFETSRSPVRRTFTNPSLILSI
ncbi:hypothetical protein GLOIN_2v1585861 [Rhizophagus irregularis DAOM 181602=DAOM 197198]|uniref:Uncharacterized protein n=1 Tax=Rhizophagus irregularis (strain DAOM 181602 / DAOM 197198 / MUCL 43194) TaxID=747089 RepID=A0A2P4Q7F2_RHIID|nr:hypothetical protein GLOIN_2v1585861 [Rhizophagus irregularis DAOM 181602=DAOM 197198]POG73565.1 hypothetical protein GLOIN_2v1585861 [Rhizophagus irregularis DAOM 181602=DAOM 197198]|eukprot:XP_025180431.1 hypothetical protein GLOIN_2v1585861 [Rhizophagus irregularis DAOM 181602=DAOM 197198]